MDGYFGNSKIVKANSIYLMKKYDYEGFKSFLDTVPVAYAICEISHSNKTGKSIDYKVLYTNKSFTDIAGLSFADIADSSIESFFPGINIHLKDADSYKNEDNKYEFEYCCSKCDKYFNIKISYVEDNKIALIFSDITRHKKLEEILRRENKSLKTELSVLKVKEQAIIKYLSYHDSLTGLFNRYFFYEEVNRLDTSRRLPISIIMADINGLKTINEKFGYEKGDLFIKTAAEAIKYLCRADEIIARLGGDEFALLLPNTTKENAERIACRLKNRCDNIYIDGIRISVSFGWDTKTEKDHDLRITIKNAETHMHRNKIFECPSSKSKLIKLMLKTLNEKNNREYSHSGRVSKLCEIMGMKMNLDLLQVNELKIIGLLHDIGKIAIDDIILNKSDELNEAEWHAIKRHPLVGHKILSSINDLSELADYVLAHQERWDGSGYPNGLKGDDIPLQSRILAVADAYDAMINNRSYRKALTKDEAIEELRKNSGVQFDPNIVSVFINKVAADIN